MAEHCATEEQGPASQRTGWRSLWYSTPQLLTGQYSTDSKDKGWVTASITASRNKCTVRPLSFGSNSNKSNTSYNLSWLPITQQFRKVVLKQDKSLFHNSCLMISPRYLLQNRIIFVCAQIWHFIHLRALWAFLGIVLLNFAEHTDK